MTEKKFNSKSLKVKFSFQKVFLFPLQPNNMVYTVKAFSFKMALNWFWRLLVFWTCQSVRKDESGEKELNPPPPRPHSTNLVWINVLGEMFNIYHVLVMWKTSTSERTLDHCPFLRVMKKVYWRRFCKWFLMRLSSIPSTHADYCKMPWTRHCSFLWL